MCECHNCQDFFEYPQLKFIENDIVEVCPLCGSIDFDNFDLMEESLKRKFNIVKKRRRK